MARAQQPDMTSWKNRIVGHGEVDPKEIIAHPRNWRTHPKFQQEALLGVIHDVGVVKSITINRQTGFLVDGHLRVALAIQEKQATIPVEYVDLSPDQELEALASIDPIAALAETNAEQLKALIDDVSTSEAAVQEMLAKMAETEGLIAPRVEFPEYDESAADEVEYITCPECGHKWPK